MDVLIHYAEIHKDERSYAFVETIKAINEAGGVNGTLYVVLPVMRKDRMKEVADALVGIKHEFIQSSYVSYYDSADDDELDKFRSNLFTCSAINLLRGVDTPICYLPVGYCPTKDSWMDVMDDAYLNGRKRFMGTSDDGVVVDSGWFIAPFSYFAMSPGFRVTQLKTDLIESISASVLHDFHDVDLPIELNENICSKLVEPNAEAEYVGEGVVARARKNVTKKKTTKRAAKKTTKKTAKKKTAKKKTASLELPSLDAPVELPSLEDMTDDTLPKPPEEPPAAWDAVKDDGGRPKVQTFKGSPTSGGFNV